MEAYQAADITYQWPTNICKEEVLKLTQADDAQAEAWYQNIILPKVFEQYEKYVVSEEALAFAANMVNTRGMAYCSQVVRLAFLQSVNFDPAPTPDQYRKLPAFLLKHFPKAVDFEMGVGFVSPSGLVWQADILESYSKFNFTHERGEEQRQSRSRVDHYNSYLGTDGDVNAMPILIKPTEIKIGEAYVGDDLNQ